MKAMLMNASVLLAQPTPRSLYIAVAKSGKPRKINVSGIFNTRLFRLATHQRQTQTS